MKVDLRNIKPDGGRLGFSELAQDLEISQEGFEFPEPIEVSVYATKSGDEIIIQGQVSTTVD